MFLQIRVFGWINSVAEFLAALSKIEYGPFRYCQTVYKDG